MPESTSDWLLALAIAALLSGFFDAWLFFN